MLKRLRNALQLRMALYTSPRYVRNRLNRPVVSLTFDDFPKSAGTVGCKILSDMDVRATYYFCADFAGRTVKGVRQFDLEDLPRLSALGHEIGCHTASHPEVPSLHPNDLDSELARNAACLRAAGITTPIRTFAYPHGRVDPRSKRRLAERFVACRGVYPQAHRGKADLGLLRCLSLEPHILAARPLDAWLDEVVRDRSWLILLTHDVDERPSPYGITPAHLANVLERVRARGIEMRTVAETVDDLVNADRPLAPAAADATPQTG